MCPSMVRKGQAMGWTRQMEAATDMLDGIVALLLSLANIAERAAYVPEARRRTVLAILRHGEFFTRDSFGIAAHPAPDRYVSSAAGSGNTPEDAMALAMSFRFLALIVQSMAAPQRRLALLPAGRMGSADLPHRDSATFRYLTSTQILDTS